MDYYCLSLNQLKDLPYNFLHSSTHSFSIEEPEGEIKYYIPIEEIVSLTISPHLWKKVTFASEVDWQTQWLNHAPQFDGQLQALDLSPYSKELTIPKIHLQPGPGFGNFSHATTRLMVAMMAHRIKNKFIIDLGCGSGILSLVALALGANFAYGLDIDEEALQHARLNATLNQLSHQTHFSQVLDCNLDSSQAWLILINMIHREQQLAWTSLPRLHNFNSDIITSGILVQDRNLYVRDCEQRGWQLVDEQQEEEWMAFYWYLS